MENLKLITQTTPKEIPTFFIGRGEVKGLSFVQFRRSNNTYIFEVSDTSGGKWYEVFVGKKDTRFNKIAYPKSNAFGVSAWTAKTYEKAITTFNQICEKDFVESWLITQ